jgi:hypothetical protein
MSKRIVFVVLAAVAVIPVSAATHQWTGTSSRLFSDAANWAGGSPQGDAQADLLFGDAPRRDLINDLESLTVKSISFSSDAYRIRGLAMSIVDGGEIHNPSITGSAIDCELFVVDPANPSERSKVIVSDSEPSNVRGGSFRYIRTAHPDDSSPRFDAISSVLSFESQGVIARVTPRAQTAWLSQARRSFSGFHSIENRRTIIDADQDGVARWALPAPLASIGIWAVVDMTNGRLHGARPDGTEFLPTPLGNVDFLRDSSGHYSWFDLPYSGAIQMMWVRPGVGAWVASAGEGAQGDHDGIGNGRLLVQAADFARFIVGSAAVPNAFERGDVVFGMRLGGFDGEHDLFFGGAVDQRLDAAPTTPAVFRPTRGSALESAAKASMTFLRTGSSDGVSSFDFNTSDGTALDGVHYVRTSGTVSFAAGELFKTVEIPLIQDDAYAGRPSFLLSMNNVAGGTYTGLSPLQFMIQDDDPLPQLAGATTTVAEGDSGEREVGLEVVLTGRTTVRATADWRWWPDAASAPPVTGQLIFEPGETRKNVAVRYIANRDPEPNREIELVLEKPTNAVVTSNGLLTIEDDDADGISVEEARVSENAENAIASVRLSTSRPEAVSFRYRTLSSSANAGEDFRSVEGSLTFAPGETQKQIRVPILQDLRIEDDELIMLEIFDASPGVVIRRARAYITIVDDDVFPTLTLHNSTVREGAEHEAYLEIEYSSSTFKSPARFMITTSSGTAEAGKDFKSVSRSVTAFSFVDDTIVIPINDDSIIESNETFTVTLSNPENALLGRATATVTIVDDEAPVPVITVGDGIAREGDALMRFEATLSFPSERDVTFRAATASGTAESGRDFEPLSTTVTVPAGQTRASIAVVVRDDSEDEGAESFTLRLSEPQNATLAAVSASGRIIDNDRAETPMVFVSDVGVSEASGTAEFTVQRSSAAHRIEVTYATSDGTAIVEGDYRATSGVLTFATRQTTQTISVPIVNDTAYESDERFTLALASNDVVVVNTAVTCTIVNDDKKPVSRTRAVRH